MRLGISVDRRKKEVKLSSLYFLENDHFLYKILCTSDPISNPLIIPSIWIIISYPQLSNTLKCFYYQFHSSMSGKDSDIVSVLQKVYPGVLKPFHCYSSDREAWMGEPHFQGLLTQLKVNKQFQSANKTY